MIVAVKRNDRIPFTSLKKTATVSEAREVFVKPRVQIENGALVTIIDSNVRSEGAVFCEVMIGSGEQGFIDRRHLKFDIKVQRCRAVGCFQCHPRHICKVCNTCDSDHRSGTCPQSRKEVFYHGTLLKNRPSNELRGILPSNDGRLGQGNRRATRAPLP